MSGFQIKFGTKGAHVKGFVQFLISFGCLVALEIIPESINLEKIDLG